MSLIIKGTINIKFKSPFNLALLKFRMSTNPNDQTHPTSKKGLKKLLKEQEKQKRKQEKQLSVENNLNNLKIDDYASPNYGCLPLNQSQEKLTTQRYEIKALMDNDAKQLDLHMDKIWLRARLQYSRAASSKLCFFTLRQAVYTIQAVLSVDESNVSKQMVKFCSDIMLESIVLIEAELTKSPEPILSCTVKNVELKVFKMFVVHQAIERLPFTIEEVSRIETDEDDNKLTKVNLDTRLNNRIIDLRTLQNQAIFRIQHHVCQIFREYLIKLNFIEIHTPKIIGSASEGGANVFELGYFKKKAFLAQSPQLYKQMAICSVSERVFEIGPVFRAENSNTHRHMTEFVGLDLEMAFESHYHEVIDVIDHLFINLFEKLEKMTYELDVVKGQFNTPRFEYLKPTSLRLEFKEGIQLLRQSGIEVNDFDDLSTENERILGKLVKEKYKTDFFILDKFPLSVRPFYTMPDPKDPNVSNSYDFFMRGEEIMSGAQRIHDPKLLEERAKFFNIDLSTIEPYLNAFKYGAPPHAGGGIGLERVVMLYLGVGNIRRCSMFPRDPQRLAP